MPNQPRLPGGAFSVASSAAPPHSPPSPMPWPKRRMQSRIGAPGCRSNRSRATKPISVVADAHHEQRGDERRFTSDAVAEVAEDERADRPRDECDAERDERRQRLCGAGEPCGKNTGPITSAAAVA